MMISTHGVGGAQDLPIPAIYAIGGAGAALGVSFIVLALAWRTPLLGEATREHQLPRVVTKAADSRLLAQLLKLFGIVSLGYLAWAALAGPDTSANPTFGSVYVLLWVGLVPASLLLGPIWRLISPARTIFDVASFLGRAVGIGYAPRRLPRWVGVWPAALGLFAWVWLELVSPDASTLDAVRLWFASYFVVLLCGAAVFGRAWFASADPFEVYSQLLGHLAPFRRSEQSGAVVLVTPLDHLARLPRASGQLAVVAVLLGSTAFDSFSRSLLWTDYLREAELDPVVPETATLAAFCVFVFATFAGASMLTGLKPGSKRSEMPGLFAHSVAPIIVGYMIAHYLTLFVEYGQQTIIQLSDPMGTGANLLGTSTLQVNYGLSSHPTLLASIKVLAVLAGHLLGVMAAHDRAIRVLPKRDELSGQLGMLFAMVIYTVGGLFLLFNG